MSTTTLTQELSELPSRSLTTMTLSALDFVIPGSYVNANSLPEMVKEVTGEARQGRLDAMVNHVEQLYAESNGAQRAVYLYKLTDRTDKAIAAASLANKVGEKFSTLSFLSKMTPKSDTIQAVDLCMKLTCEGLAYLSLHGLSKDAISEWAGSLNSEKNYHNEAALRLAAIVAIDGLIPLGPDFLEKVGQQISSGKMPWSDNTLFKKVSEYIPGGGTDEKGGFVADLFKKVSSPLDSFISRTGLSKDKVVGSLKTVTDMSDDKLDYVAAFFDASTSFVSHTGVQSVARQLTDQAAVRFGYQPA